MAGLADNPASPLRAVDPVVQGYVTCIDSIQDDDRAERLPD